MSSSQALCTDQLFLHFLVSDLNFSVTDSLNKNTAPHLNQYTFTFLVI